MFRHLYKTNQGQYDLDPQNFVTSIKFMYEDGVFTLWPIHVCERVINLVKLYEIKIEKC
jgi:hypothetical protein